MSTHAGPARARSSRCSTDAGVLADAQVFVGRARRARRPRARWCAQAWDLDEIEARYEEFLAEFARPARARPAGRRRSSSCTPGAGSRGSTRRCRRSLLPRPWSGVAPREAVRPAARPVVADARAAWRALDDAGGLSMDVRAGAAPAAGAAGRPARARRGVRADAQQRQPVDDRAHGRLLRRSSG